MSRTYRDIRKWKTSKFWDDYYSERRANNTPWTFAPWASGAVRKKERAFISKNKKVYKNTQQLYTNYSGAPSWFTRLYTNLPKRRLDKKLANLASIDTISSDSFIWSETKSFTYYW